MEPSPPPRPSWQVAACPTWCVAHHHEHDLPEDRRHESAARAVPVTTPKGEPAELFVALSRLDHDPVEWVFVGESRLGGQYLRVSRESAQRVAQALLRAVSDTPDATDKSVAR